MSYTQQVLTTRQFAGQAGVSPATVLKWLRDGRIKGRKTAGKWSIPVDQLARVVSAEPDKDTTVPGQPQPGTSVKRTPQTPAVESTQTTAYSVAEFSNLTYLTEWGVEQWLKEGRLQGSRDSAGHWRVDGGNLTRADFQRLLRK